MSADGAFLLNYDLHEQERTSKLNSIWKNEDFLDVTIACDDDQIDAHKVILSSASPFFHNILKRNPHSHPLLYLRGTKKKDFESLLEFIYSGQTEILQGQLEDFMTLANSLQVKGLSDIGENVKDIAVSKKKETCEYKLSNPKKKSKVSFKNETVVQLSEDVSKMNDDVSVITESFEFDKTNISLENNDDSITSLTEYDEQVLSLIKQSEDGWSCTVCAHKVKKKGHMREHAQEHIEGYSHQCNYCDRTFPMKRTLRHHERRCKLVLLS